MLDNIKKVTKKITEVANCTTVKLIITPNCKNLLCLSKESPNHKTRLLMVNIEVLVLFSVFRVYITLLCETYCSQSLTVLCSPQYIQPVYA